MAEAAPLALFHSEYKQGLLYLNEGAKTCGLPPRIGGQTVVITITSLENHAHPEEFANSTDL